MDGSIVRMVLEDFMTFKKVVFKAGPHLNVIIGPNGTGKSTVVCAMVLGLGGKPKLLGRAVALNSYIRTNCRTARIEVELKNLKGNNYVITRTITEDGKSSWLLGGTQVTQKQVDDLVGKLNIQVDNLCQFLPQDRVADFSKMNPQQLLENTQKCVGPPELFEYHTELKELSKQQMQLERQLNSTTQKLESEEQRNDRIQVVVGNISEKKTLMQLVENLKQKRAWLVYDVMRTRSGEMKADKDRAVKSSRSYAKRYEPMERIVAATKAKVNEIERNLGVMNMETNKKLSALNEIQEAIEHAEGFIKDNVRECDHRIQAEKKRQDEVRDLFKQIGTLENVLKGFTEESVNALKTEQDNVRAQLNEKGSGIDRLRHEREKYRSDLEKTAHDILMLENEQQKVEDVANQRLELLRRRQRDIYDAVMWLRENRNMFRRHIYEPMMLEINVTNLADAKYIEKIVSNRDLLAFTCEDKEDMNKLVQILRDQKNLKINVIHSGSEHPPSSSFKPSVPIGSLRQFGFHTYIVDMITAPEAILKYLCRMYWIHNIPVGDATTFSYSDRVPDSINCFFSANHNFNVRKSKYSGEKSTQTSEVPAPFYLAISVNVQHLQQIRDKLIALKKDKQEVMNTLESVQRQLHRGETEMEGLRTRRKKLTERLEQLRTVEVKLNARRKQLEILESEKLDPELEKAKCRENNKKLVLGLREQNGEMVELLKQYDESLVENKVLYQVLDDMRYQATKKENDSQELFQKWTESKALVGKIEEKLRLAKIETKRLFEEAKVMTGGVSPADEAFQEFRSVFHILGDTEEELDREIQDKQAKADCLGEGDETVMQEYETRRTQIASLTASIEEKKRECERLKEEMIRINDKWLPPLKELVSQISKKYGDCFAQLECAGEVALLFGQNETDYEQYGLSIKVKFRDGEQLQELTQHLQSGGERAVATAVYMISLQGLTRVPFCCVDEINQGMDAVNERMIFELLVATTRQSGTAQYFLLTPKLLPSLLYDRTMVVHCVYNGVGALSNDDWDMNDIIERIARIHK